MTRTGNARLAGLTLLLYIATGIASMVVFGKAAGDGETAAVLASLARHAAAVRVTVLLTLLTWLEAIVLGVTLYALTRDQDRDLALLALCCRLSEGVIGAVSTVRTLGLPSVAAAASATGPEGAAATALGTLLLQQGGGTAAIGGTCFAIGSALFSWLFLRARSVPIPLAWLGLLASLLLVVALPVRLAGHLNGSLAWLVWMPMLAFEVPLGLWLLIKGATERSRS